MNENRTANALPGRTGSKADHQTQQELMRRTADAGPGASIIHTHTGAFVEPRRRRSDRYIHPWKVTANGDDTVKVYSGEAFYPGGADPVVYYTAEHTTADVQVTAATGIIYFNIAAAVPMTLDEAIVAGVDAYSMMLDVGTVEFHATPIVGAYGNILDTTNIYFPIATVALTNGVATVTKQIAKGQLFSSIQTLADG